MTGIGRWTEEDFVRTIRTGVNPSGDSLNPIMPWRTIRRMTDDDLRAMYMYLRTVPALPQRGEESLTRLAAQRLRVSARRRRLLVRCH